MIVNYKNISEIFEKDTREYELLKALLDDLYMYNEKYFPKEMSIEYVTDHTEYSPERTDPCPDYYHTFNIRWKGFSETIVDNLTLHDLDEHMCTLCCAFEQLKEYV